jgi:hypothetical protein
MTEFRLTRRTPAGRLRYLADQVGRTNGLDQDDHTRLAAVRLQLERMADEFDGVAAPATQASEPTVPSARELGESLAFAMDAMKPSAEPIFCHHPNRRIQWRRAGRLSIATATCPDCPARAEQADAEPVLQPWLLNAGRCTNACTERHTYRDGCQMAPDFSKP